MATNNSINNQITSANFTVSAGLISLPTTSSTVGQLTINSVPVLHAYGTDNIFVGGGGNLTTSITQSVVIGKAAATLLTSGCTGSVTIGYGANFQSTSGYGQYSINIGNGASRVPSNYGIHIGNETFASGAGGGSQMISIGYRSMYGSSNTVQAYNSIAIGPYSAYSIDGSVAGYASYNTIIGYKAAYSMTTGKSNLILGSCDAGGGTDVGSGSSYTSSESGNILLANLGVAGDSSVIRIGTMSGLTYNQTKTYIAGIYNYTGTIGTTGTAAMIIDSAGQIQSAHAFSADANCKTVSLIKSRGTSATPTVITTGDALGIIDFRGHDGTGYIVGSQITSTSSGTIATNRVASDLKFYTHPDSITASTLRMTIDSVGGVTIAAADSGTELTVTGEVSATTVYATTFDTNVAAAAVTLAGTTLAADGSDTDISITITPKGAGLLVSSNNIQCLPTYSNTVTGNAVLVDSSGNYGVATSSIRFKDNVRNMGDSSEFLMDLRPVTFNYKNDKFKRQKFGLIAEEVHEIAPHLVSYDDECNPYAVNYHELPAILLNEIQKLHKRIETLEEKLASPPSPKGYAVTRKEK